MKISGHFWCQRNWIMIPERNDTKFFLDEIIFELKYRFRAERNSIEKFLYSRYGLVEPEG